MMLGKTAGGLFWMFRYLERAENTARLLEAGWRIALTSSDDEGENEWESVITTAGIKPGYEARHDSYDAENVIDYLLRDQGNPSSVMSCIAAARSNGRLVRTALSSEVWEATNETWMVLKKALARPVSERQLHETLMLVRNRSSMVRGALHGTMLRNDIFSFSHIGTYVERADNTARILDVKYYVLLPSMAHVGGSIDNVQWDVILRSVSAARSYRWLNGGEMSPLSIADFLILDLRMPRSLAFCQLKIGESLARLEQNYGQRHPCHDLARRNAERLEEVTIEMIFDEGVHEFLRACINDNATLAGQIQADYRVNE